MLENLPWDRFIKLYDSPDTFFFIDPPYIGHDEYRHNLNFDDFGRLADCLARIKGKFLMTHTDSPDIRGLFRGMRFENIEIKYSTHQLTPGQKPQIGREVLISNY